MAETGALVMAETGAWVMAETGACVMAGTGTRAAPVRPGIRCDSGRNQEFQGQNQVYYWEESGVSGSESGVLLGRVRSFRVRIRCTTGKNQDVQGQNLVASGKNHM